MSSRRHLRLVAIGDDVDPPPPVPARVRARDARLYAAELARFEAEGLHPAVAAIEAALSVERHHRRKGRP
jgi:hypothetical protein